MIKILHRVNNFEKLNATPTDLGIEVDIRSNGNDLIIHHDPFKDGELFDDWLRAFRHKTLILNVKEEGLEDKLIERMKQHEIDDFFFLDQSFPFLRMTANKGENRCAVRISEYESIETALSMTGLVKWVWVDCFNNFPLQKKGFDLLKLAGFSLCLVSPELQGRNHDDIIHMRKLLKHENIQMDAVCTKFPQAWS